MTTRVHSFVGSTAFEMQSSRSANTSEEVRLLGREGQIVTGAAHFSDHQVSIAVFGHGRREDIRV